MPGPSSQLEMAHAISKDRSLKLIKRPSETQVGPTQDLFSSSNSSSFDPTNHTILYPAHKCSSYLGYVAFQGYSL